MASAWTGCVVWLMAVGMSVSKGSNNVWVAMLGVVKPMQTGVGFGVHRSDVSMGNAVNLASVWRRTDAIRSA